MSVAEKYEKEKAWVVAYRVMEKIMPHCENSEVCGGLRRGNETVHDIDIVAQPNDFFSISTKVGQLGGKCTPSKYSLNIDGIPVEIFIANDEKMFDVLKLVRTGSAGFNFELAMKAHEKDLTLKYSNGLYGLYAAVQGWDSKVRKFKYYCNPLRRLHWKEDDMIMTVLDEEEYLDPHNRNVQNSIFSRILEDA